MRSSCLVSGEDSTRCLVDSRDSTIQPQILFDIFWDVNSSFAAIFVVLVRAFLWHGMVAAMGLSQYYPRIFESFFVILVIRINEVNSSQSSSIVEFWLLVSPFLFFSILNGFTNFGPYFWPYMIWSGSRLNSCQSPSTPHIALGRFFFQKSELRGAFPRI